MRSEQEIFDELAELCTSTGFIHAIAYFCFRDNFVVYVEELKAEDYQDQFSSDRLIRTEISTLIGLNARGPIDYTPPPAQQLHKYIEQAEALLSELHEAMKQPFMEDFMAKLANPKASPFESAEAMREPIFYGSESAFSFQYRDFAPQKYLNDEAWLQKNKGFSIGDGQKIVAAILNIQEEKNLTTLQGLRKNPNEEWSALAGFEFSHTDIVKKSGLSTDIVKCFLNAFSFVHDNNPDFTALHEFNATNAFPILKVDDERYFVFQYVSLAEALYDTPFYWMIADEKYQQTAMSNRGMFTEVFGARRLSHVFGPERVFRNVDIWKSKGKKLGEIDVLVLFADRVVVVQAKSKKLTLSARKGNDFQLKADFKGAVQDACDQAYACSENILLDGLTFTDSSGKKIPIPKTIKQVFPVCLVSDHYPALAFQARQFLKYTSTEVIRPPLVCDVFLFDTIAEMLDSPLRFLSYLELRAIAGDRLLLTHELNALAFHLRQNLCFGDIDLVDIGDDITADVQIAMAARREGIQGERTPRGILTKINDFTVGNIIKDIEKRSDSSAISVGLELLKLNGESIEALSKGIDKISSDAESDKQHHDITLGFNKAGSGVTVHCDYRQQLDASTKLIQHCKLRKYGQKAPKWFGLAIEPGNASFRFGVVLDFPWQVDGELEKITGKMPAGITREALDQLVQSRPTNSKKKIGRNDPCPCGSGLKYKKCCLMK